jgi:hypothetical protein
MNSNDVTGPRLTLATWPTFGGLTADEVVTVMQHWETRAASEEQTAISVKLGQLREEILAAERVAPTVRPAKSADRLKYEDVLGTALLLAYDAINDSPDFHAGDKGVRRDWVAARGRAVSAFDAAIDKAGYVPHLERKP